MTKSRYLTAAKLLPEKEKRVALALLQAFTLSDSIDLDELFELAIKLPDRQRAALRSGVDAVIFKYRYETYAKKLLAKMETWKL